MVIQSILILLAWFFSFLVPLMFAVDKHKYDNKSNNINQKILDQKHFLKQ